MSPFETDTPWGDPAMDALDRKLRLVLAESGVLPEDQSSILHTLAADADAEAFQDSTN